ncbi:MAG: hypothetical protein JXQ66_00620, partial [Campylobacterales bacterium]|nr:hypothetical protein [Campylobacterales bacterium]
MRFLFIMFSMISILSAEFEMVKVGSIDARYKDIVSKQEIQEIIYEIRNCFDEQLGFKTFDYKEDGKPIDIIYIQPSAKKQRIVDNDKKMQSIKGELDSFSSSINSKHSDLESSKVL